MSVVINDFEVVPQSNAPAAAPASPKDASPALSERDVREIVRREHEREKRVRAH
jgi:hypothetical protein